MFNIISYGINKYDNKRGIGTTHSEEDAIYNLPKAPTNKNKLININIIVIKTSKTGILSLSKPCIHCILLMNTLPNKKGYIIKNIYYSDENGNIIKTTINKLLLDKIHVSNYYRINNFKYSV